MVLLLAEVLVNRFLLPFLACFIILVDNTLLFKPLNSLNDIVLAVPLRGLVVDFCSGHVGLQILDVLLPNRGDFDALNMANGIVGCWLGNIPFETRMFTRYLENEVLRAVL